MRKSVLLSLPLLLVVAGCATSTRDTYMEQDVGRVMETTRGTVVAARDVSIRGESSGLGPTIGGASGGIVAASTIGSGDGSVVAGVLGGLVGIAVGYMAEDAIRGRDGTEYTIETEDGRIVTLVQNREDQTIPAGTPVMVQWGTEYSRVVPLQGAAAPAAYGPGASSAPAGGEWINPDTVPAGHRRSPARASGEPSGASPYDPSPRDAAPYDSAPYDSAPYDPGPYDPAPYDPEDVSPAGMTSY